MATPSAEEIRKKLRDQAEQRINPLLKGLTMLTGGLAGEFTGTNEQIRQRNLAKRALMEEDLAALQEQRLNERMKAQRGQMLEDQLKLQAAQDAAVARRQRDAEIAAREAKRPEMLGLLESRPNYQVGGDRGLGGAMAAPISALEPIEEVERQYSYEKALQGQEEQDRRIKSGYMSYNIPGRGTVGGTPEQIEAMAEKDPVLKKFLSQAPSEEPLFSTTWGVNPFTNRPEAKLTFSKSVPYEEQKRLVEQFMGQSGPSPFDGEPAPGTPSSKKEEEPTSIPGYNVRLSGTKR
jgi:hypothetical protein